MLEFVKQLDQQMFVWIYQQGAFSFGDVFFPFLTNIQKTVFFKIILVLALGFWVYKKRKEAVKRILFLALVVGSADQLVYHVIKVPLARARPHHIQEMKVQVKVPYGPKSYSFPSNHATNSAALMTGLSFYFPAYTGAFVFWAVLMAYSRVYVGVHWPLDVLAGLFIGWLWSYSWFRWWIKKDQKQ